MITLNNGALEYAKQFVDGLQVKFAPQEQNAIIGYIVRQIDDIRKKEYADHARQASMMESAITGFWELIEQTSKNKADVEEKQTNV